MFAASAVPYRRWSKERRRLIDRRFLIQNPRHVRVSSLSPTPLGKKQNLVLQRKLIPSKRHFLVSAEYCDGSRGGGTDFVAGFLLGGAIFGTLGYVFAPQIWFI